MGADLRLGRKRVFSLWEESAARRCAAVWNSVVRNSLFGPDRILDDSVIRSLFGAAIRVAFRLP